MPSRGLHWKNCKLRLVSSIVLVVFLIFLAIPPPPPPPLTAPNNTNIPHEPLLSMRLRRTVHQANRHRCFVHNHISVLVGIARAAEGEALLPHPQGAPEESEGSVTSSTPSGTSGSDTATPPWRQRTGSHNRQNRLGLYSLDHTKAKHRIVAPVQHALLNALRPLPFTSFRSPAH